jgi:hypothetical protein
MALIVIVEKPISEIILAELSQFFANCNTVISGSEPVVDRQKQKSRENVAWLVYNSLSRMFFRFSRFASP